VITTIGVNSRAGCEFIDITAEIKKIIAEANIHSGVCHMYVPHTTAGVTINEGADPDVRRDIIAALDRVFPVDGDYRHAEGNSDAHIKATLTGSSAVVFVEDGKPVLGTWQAIYFCEYDGPRKRKLMVRIVQDR
jgi:secondary thiamine-phosphate synthase enzyme